MSFFALFVGACRVVLFLLRQASRASLWTSWSRVGSSPETIPSRSSNRHEMFVFRPEFLELFFFGGGKTILMASKTFGCFVPTICLPTHSGTASINRLARAPCSLSSWTFTVLGLDLSNGNQHVWILFLPTHSGSETRIAGNLYLFPMESLVWKLYLSIKYASCSNLNPCVVYTHHTPVLFKPMNCKEKLPLTQERNERPGNQAEIRMRRAGQGFPPSLFARPRLTSTFCPFRFPPSQIRLDFRFCGVSK